MAGSNYFNPIILIIINKNLDKSALTKLIAIADYFIDIYSHRPIASIGNS